MDRIILLFIALKRHFSNKRVVIGYLTVIGIVAIIIWHNKQNVGQKDSITTSMEYNHQPTKTPESIICPPANFASQAIYFDAITDLSITNGNRLITRHSINVTYKEEISGDLLDKEIRHWIHFVYKKEPQSKTISVKCFTEGNRLSFMNGYFAPFGKWASASNDADISNYQIAISYF